MEVRWLCDNDVTGNISGSTCDAQKVRSKSSQRKEERETELYVLFGIIKQFDIQPVHVLLFTA